MDDGLVYSLRAGGGIVWWDPLQPDFNFDLSARIELSER